MNATFYHNLKTTNGEIWRLAAISSVSVILISCIIYLTNAWRVGLYGSETWTIVWAKE